jgi:hypothetical protein
MAHQLPHRISQLTHRCRQRPGLLDPPLVQLLDRPATTVHHVLRLSGRRGRNSHRHRAHPRICPQDDVHRRGSVQFSDLVNGRRFRRPLYRPVERYWDRHHLRPRVHLVARNERPVWSQSLQRRRSHRAARLVVAPRGRSRDRYQSTAQLERSSRPHLVDRVGRRARADDASLTASTPSNTLALLLQEIVFGGGVTSVFKTFGAGIDPRCWWPGRIGRRATGSSASPGCRRTPASEG